MFENNRLCLSRLADYVCPVLFMKDGHLTSISKDNFRDKTEIKYYLYIYSERNRKFLSESYQNFSLISFALINIFSLEYMVQFISYTLRYFLADHN